MLDGTRTALLRQSQAARRAQKLGPDQKCHQQQRQSMLTNPKEAPFDKKDPVWSLSEPVTEKITVEVRFCIHPARDAKGPRGGWNTCTRTDHEVHGPLHTHYGYIPSSPDAHGSPRRLGFLHTNQSCGFTNPLRRCKSYRNSNARNLMRCGTSRPSTYPQQQRPFALESALKTLVQSVLSSSVDRQAGLVWTFFQQIGKAVAQERHCATGIRPCPVNIQR